MSDTVSAERRGALVEQLRYLIDEVDALGPLLAVLPADVPTMHLPGERSILGTLAHLAALDRRALDRLGQMLQEEEPAFEDASLDEEAPGEIESVVQAVKEARNGLADAFEALSSDEWSCTATLPDGRRCDVAGFALAITQRDTDALRRVAHRLHESNLRHL